MGFSLTENPRLAQCVARWLPGYAYDEQRFFAVDGAPAEVVARRRAGFARLARTFAARYPTGTAMSALARTRLPDLQLIAAYRVPFPFSPFVQQHLKLPSFARATAGRHIEDVDGNRCFDLTGSYGVNLFGNDFYKACIDDAVATARELGPVLGTLHPCVADNAERLAALSGQEAVSFHMSGTEAVMQAVRLARYHTRRKVVARFGGAYHGWWDDVQPGPGNPIAPRWTLTLPDASERALETLRRRRDVACVLVNPLQALHPNRSAPTDSQLVDSTRRAHFDRDEYAAWLRKLREVCTERGIVLILDEVFVGFRLARGGAQEYFGVRADLVTYGKTLGGGLPIGAVCGPHSLMSRFRDARPADLCFARGTFNSHPYVMGAVRAFLDRLETGAVRALYAGLDERWRREADAFDAALGAAKLPVRIAALSTIWTVLYAQPSHYNWMFQYYLRERGLQLSWVGSGRLIFSLDYTPGEVADVRARFVAAATTMHDDGWWWSDGTLTDRAIRRSMFREMLRRR